jgi:transposase
LKRPVETEKSLTSKQLEAIALLAQGITIQKTAERVGTSEKTVDRWKRQAKFRQAIQEAEDAIFQGELRLLRKTVKPAIAALVRNLESTKGYVQVQAASKLLDLHLELHKMERLEQRIQELEDAIRDRVE